MEDFPRGFLCLSVVRPVISMAPLRGVTMRQYRDLYAKFFGGVDLAVSPFIPLPSADKTPPGYFKDVANPQAGLRTIPQVIGKSPERLAYAARMLRDMGHSELNLNCGCPWKFVAAKGRGSGLPENEELFAKMLDSGCRHMPGGFSIKIRLGRFSADTLFKRIPVILSFPLKAVVIHPRTASQMYTGDVDKDSFAAALDMLSPHIPVVYNGDVTSLEYYAGIVERFPSISGVMIGRGLIADPFLPGRIALWEEAGRPSVSGDGNRPAALTDEEADSLLSFSESLYSKYRETLCGPAPVLGRMKEYWGYAAAGLPHGSEILTKIRRSSSLEEYEKAVSMFRNKKNTRHLSV